MLSSPAASANSSGPTPFERFLSPSSKDQSASAISSPSSRVSMNDPLRLVWYSRSLYTSTLRGFVCDPTFLDGSIVSLENWTICKACILNKWGRQVPSTISKSRVFGASTHLLCAMLPSSGTTGSIPQGPSYDCGNLRVFRSKISSVPNNWCS